MDGIYHMQWGLPLQNGKGFATFHIINGKYQIQINHDWKGNLIEFNSQHPFEDIKPE